MSLIKGFFAKPTFSVQPIRADRAEECERLHAASFAFPWSSSDFESYLTDSAILADGAVNDTAPKGPLGGFIMSRLTPPDAEVLTFAVDPARRGTGLGDLYGVATGVFFGLYFLAVKAARGRSGAARGWSFWRWPTTTPPRWRSMSGPASRSSADAKIITSAPAASAGRR